MEQSLFSKAKSLSGELIQEIACSNKNTNLLFGPVVKELVFFAFIVFCCKYSYHALHHFFAEAVWFYLNATWFAMLSN